MKALIVIFLFSFVLVQCREDDRKKRRPVAETEDVEKGKKDETKNERNPRRRPPRPSDNANDADIKNIDKLPVDPIKPPERGEGQNVFVCIRQYAGLSRTATDDTQFIETCLSKLAEREKSKAYDMLLMTHVPSNPGQFPFKKSARLYDAKSIEADRIAYMKSGSAGVYSAAYAVDGYADKIRELKKRLEKAEKEEQEKDIEDLEKKIEAHEKKLAEKKADYQKSLEKLHDFIDGFETNAIVLDSMKYDIPWEEVDHFHTFYEGHSNYLSSAEPRKFIRSIHDWVPGTVKAIKHTHNSCKSFPEYERDEVVEDLGELTDGSKTEITFCGNQVWSSNGYACAGGVCSPEGEKTDLDTPRIVSHSGQTLMCANSTKGSAEYFVPEGVSCPEVGEDNEDNHEIQFVGTCAEPERDANGYTPPIEEMSLSDLEYYVGQTFECNYKDGSKGCRVCALDPALSVEKAIKKRRAIWIDAKDIGLKCDGKKKFHPRLLSGRDS